ncbi:MAG: phage portal protein [Prevotella sp.]|nr:phage portal protein [Prevotella sp.]
MPITDIIDFSRPISEIIAALKDKSVLVPSWGALLQEYDETRHDILTDPAFADRSTPLIRRSRITLALEKLLTRRYAEFTFAIPVKRKYANPDKDETAAEIIKAIERIYKSVLINDENLARARAYYAACEVFTMWYAVKKPNSLYGFPSNYKLKCKTYSPMNGAHLYPIIDELDDMIAMSFEYKKRVYDRTVTFFETYTADKHYIWAQGMDGGADWQQQLYSRNEEDGERVEGEDIQIGKIPGVYLWRPQPVYAGLSRIRNDIEYTLTRNSNTIADNAAPILKVIGELRGSMTPNDSQRIFRIENGGDVDYVSWVQATESIKYQVETLLDLYFMQAQMPDLSFSKMAALGNIGYDARQTLLTDPHLRIGDEEGAWVRFFSREFNVIKAFLKLMNIAWAEMLDDITCDHIITPFIQNDREKDVELRIKANGGKAVESQRESIFKLGESDDPDATLAQIQAEAKQAGETDAQRFAMNNSMF